jgi:hypothetical protein
MKTVLSSKGHAKGKVYSYECLHKKTPQIHRKVKTSQKKISKQKEIVKIKEETKLETKNTYTMNQ